jgi:hypothetical protein
MRQPTGRCMHSSSTACLRRHQHSVYRWVVSSVLHWSHIQASRHVTGHKKAHCKLSNDHLNDLLLLSCPSSCRSLLL